LNREGYSDSKKGRFSEEDVEKKQFEVGKITE
jgi:hypothetical protein